MIWISDVHFDAFCSSHLEDPLKKLEELGQTCLARSLCRSNVSLKGKLLCIGAGGIGHSVWAAQWKWKHPAKVAGSGMSLSGARRGACNSAPVISCHLLSS